MSVLAKLLAIDVATWTWNEASAEVGHTPGTPGIGVIAQQLAEHFPALVHERPDGYVEVDYGGLVGIMLAGLQELAREVRAAKSEPAP